mgnify:FL=1
MKLYKKIYDFYIEKDEESLIKYLVPEYYIDKNKINVKYAIRILQNELNSILNSFINGGFSNKGYIFYPFVKDVSKGNIIKIKRLEKVAVFLHNNGHDFSESIKYFKNGISNGNFAQILSALYKDFSKIENIGTKLIKKLKCEEVSIKEYNKSDMDYVKPLEGLKKYANKNLKQYLLGFYLHGSLATKDYIRHWSDVDTVSIISKDTIKYPKKLLELRNNMYYARRFFCQIDPLQHHGSIVISEYDMESYCQVYFPIPVFQYAKSFFKHDSVMQFRARDFSNESIRRLFWFVSYFRKFAIEKRFNLGSYDFKVLLHSITLFPTMYLQAKGINVYKKFSFDLAKKEFNKRLWRPIDTISSIRKKWKTPNKIPLIDLISSVNPLLAYQLNSKYWDVFHNINGLNKINMRKLVEEMHALSENAWAKIKV